METKAGHPAQRSLAKAFKLGGEAKCRMRRLRQLLPGKTSVGPPMSRPVQSTAEVVAACILSEGVAHTEASLAEKLRSRWKILYVRG